MVLEVARVVHLVGCRGLGNLLVSLVVTLRKRARTHSILNFLNCERSLVAALRVVDRTQVVGEDCLA